MASSSITYNLNSLLFSAQVPNPAGSQMWPVDFGTSSLYATVRAIALQLLAAAREAAADPGGGGEPSFTTAGEFGAIAKPARSSEVFNGHGSAPW